MSYNQIWGDADDETFIITKPNHLKFRTESGEVIEMHGAEGLNYKIEEM